MIGLGRRVEDGYCRSPCCGLQQELVRRAGFFPSVGVLRMRFSIDIRHRLRLGKLPRANGRYRFGQGTFARASCNDQVAPKPDARKGGVWLANVTPMADLRRDITVTCGKPNTSELSFVRAVIAGAWDPTIGIRRGAFADGVNLVGRHAEGDARLGRQSLGIAPLRAASGIQSRPAGLRSSTRETAG